MVIRTTCNKQTSEPRKRLTKLRSVKVASLDRSRLSLKRKKSGSMGIDDIVKLRSSPNYMKATSCSYAKRGSLQPNPGDGSTEIRYAKKAVKRFYSLKRSRSRLPTSTISSLHLQFHISREFEDSNDHPHHVGTRAEANIQLSRSGSIKLNRIKSVKLPRRRWSKSRFNRASILMTNVDEAPGEVSSEAIISDSQADDMGDTSSHSARRRWSKSRFDQASIFMTNDDEAPSFEAMMSDSQENDMEGSSSHSARTKTPINSSEDARGLKPTRTLWKIPSLGHRRLHIKKQSECHEVGKTQFDLSTCCSTIKSSKFPQPVLNSTAQVCTYRYCSIHGNASASSPPRNSFVSYKRRSLKKQKSTTRKRKSETESKNETVTGASAATDMPLDKKKYTNMWNLIYASHFLVHGNELTGDVYEKRRDEEDRNDVAESEKPELNQAEAIEFVQQAVDEILLLDEQLSFHQPIHSNMAVKNVEACRDIRRSLEQPLLDPSDLKDIHQAKESANNPEKENSNATRFPQRQRSKGFQRMRKAIAITKFIKAMEKHGPRQFSSEVHYGKETRLLGHLSMDKRKDTEEWRLDTALQQVITKLDPAQRKRVAKLVEAFERVTQDASINRNPTKLLPAKDSTPKMISVKEERSITSDHGNSRSCGNINAESRGSIDDCGTKSRELMIDNPHGEYIEPRAPKGILAEAISIEHPTRDHQALVEVEPKNPFGGCKVDNNVGKDTDFHFDKEKFANVWQRVCQRFTANEAIDSRSEKKVDADATKRIKYSNPNPRQHDMKQGTVRGNHLTQSKMHGLKQADAVQYVQEAIDELLDLHEQLSDQQSSDQCKAPEHEKTVGVAELYSETRDTVMTKTERRESNQQRPFQNQTSKTCNKLWKMVGSTKFIKAMDKVSKINPLKPHHQFLEAGSGTESVYLKHWSMDERKSREEWLLDYALQEVITKLAPAQQKKVAMLTQAFDSFSSEQQQESKKCFPKKTKPAYDIALATTNVKDHGQRKSDAEDDDNPNVYKDDIRKPDDQVLVMIEDALAFQQDNTSENLDTEFDMELYDDNSELSGVNLHIHDQGSPKGCPVCYPQASDASPSSSN